MDSSVVTLHNASEQDVTVIYKNKPLTLAPFEPHTVPAEDVEDLLSQNDALMVAEGEIGSAEVDQASAKMMWIANVTGDPLEPEFVTIRGNYDRKSGQYARTEIPNPKRRPHVISRSYTVGTTEVLGRTGVEGRNQAPELISIKPFQRLLVDTVRGTWFLRRDAQMEPHCRGQAVVSRPKGDFEPNASWSLDDIRLWLLLADHRRANVIRQESELNSDVDIAQEKRLALIHVFFASANARTKLPTRARFDSVKKSLAGGAPKMPTPEPEADEMEALLAAYEEADGIEAPAPKKKVGRPRKDATL